MSIQKKSKNTSEYVYEVEFQESSRDYRTEIPNIVIALFKQKKISLHAYVLYTILRQTAGEHGECWKGTRKLAEETGFSLVTISKAKKELSNKFEELQFFPLIMINPGNKKLETADTIVIVDIWRFNHTYFKKNLTCSPRESGVFAQGIRGVRPGNQNNEPKKKETHINKDDKRITSEPSKSEENFVDRSSSSFIKNEKEKQSKPSVENNFTDEEKELSRQIDYIGNIVFKDGSKIKPQTAMRWISKHEFKDIKLAVEYYLKITRIKSKTNDKIVNHEAYFETILKKRYWEIKEQISRVKSQVQEHEDRKRKDQEYWDKRGRGV